MTNKAKIYCCMIQQITMYVNGDKAVARTYSFVRLFRVGQSLQKIKRLIRECRMLIKSACSELPRSIIIKKSFIFI